MEPTKQTFRTQRAYLNYVWRVNERARAVGARAVFVLDERTFVDVPTVGTFEYYPNGASIIHRTNDVNTRKHKWVIEHKDYRDLPRTLWLEGNPPFTFAKVNGLCVVTNLL